MADLWKESPNAPKLSDVRTVISQLRAWSENQRQKFLNKQLIEHQNLLEHSGIRKLELQLNQQQSHEDNNGVFAKNEKGKDNVLDKSISESENTQDSSITGHILRCFSDSSFDSSNLNGNKDSICKKTAVPIIPFGLSTSPGVFQRYVSSIFRDLTRKGIVISYLDDLVIPAKDEKEGLEKLKIVFEVAKKYGLEIKFKKCQFLKKTIEFLGHVVENGTIKPSTAKTQAVQKFPEPTTIKQVQSFLGLTGYFRKYIKDYSTIAKPLSDLTRKENPFVFGTLQKVAFEKLKNIMSEGPLLHIYKYGRRTELHTDACKQGYGAILLQEAEDGKLHPVYYMAKKTNTAEEKYDSYELEVLAIINALKKFRVYLLGQHFKIVTDCSAFQKTMHKKDLITRIAR
ncbi:hypothetical protein TNIN_251891 [Trichonephila inaurata madagascariensis]|uniref:RNA-directed DNA polymerase n=1 Tax=Trichonephila inaurata madagascariensis TaxID=2747483 RepID=A0A8X6WU71_9ARAC|nr:hypothetical protein TNIN_251891 [Trichonephila inaurata madagascariensis]